MLYQFEHNGEVLTYLQTNKILCEQLNISNPDKIYLSWYFNLLAMLALNIEYNSKERYEHVQKDANDIELSHNAIQQLHYVQLFTILQKQFSLITKK